MSHAPAGPSLETLLDRVARAFEPMTLVAGATAHSEAHFKTLFVEFDDPRLLAIQRRLRDELGRDEGYVLRPHLSLLYRGSCLSRRAGASPKPIASRASTIEFDVLVAVRPSPPGGDLSDIDTIDTSLRRSLHRASSKRGG
ncbi:MAG: hypothetical protein M5U30_18895 [Burkholderiaceae bacterium]|nr:hypothetical protein [Burkholderiaceae bacterium]